MTHGDETNLEEAAGNGSTSSIRAFIALPLSEDAQRGASALRDKLQAQFSDLRLRWVRPENLHLTLRFLGQLEPSKIAVLARELKTSVASQPAFSFRLTNPFVFPSPARPRVIALGLEPAEPVVRLAQAVERAVRAANLPPEDRSFRPHITLARFPKKAKLTNLTAELEIGEIHERASEIALFRSVLHSTGPVYSVLERVALDDALSEESSQ
ncbi:MAG: RNA 2',3'-cyclic phosphodiesterase [Deltaproteobacteria bacterium]|nr:RNA 2',3'-cyclic phosphodiesterase [Deltaproteobacteria bacterium]